MTRLNVLLLAVLLVSSLYLVRVSYESRRLFAELDKAQNEERALDTDSERLAMRAATPAVTQYVALPTAASAAASGANR